MKILLQRWIFGKVVWGFTWEGTPETTMRELKLAACVALGKSAASVAQYADHYVSQMCLISWQNAAAARNDGQILDDCKTLAEYKYQDGELISVGISNNF